MPKGLVLILAVVLLCCAPDSVQATQFQDALGRPLVLTGPPRRIISLVPSVTEILFALGAEQQLAAVTDYCTYPAAALELPSIGNYAAPSLEQILLHGPDLVIAAADMNSPQLVSKLERLNIPVYVVYPHTVSETLATIKQLGRLTGRDEQARTLTTSLQNRVDLIRARIPAGRQPSVLACVMLEPLTVAGPGTLIDDLVRLAGGRNRVPAGPSRYPTWNADSLLSHDPEVIVISTHPGQPDPSDYFHRWPQLRAVRHNRIVEIDADWLHRPGPRLVKGLAALVAAFYPDDPGDD